jgi:hypothetical protein
MPVGLQLPVGVDPAGAVALIEGDEQASKIIRTALSPCYSNHAFQQDLGLGEGAIFDMATAEGKARLRSRIRRLFSVFRAEDRYRLVEGSVTIEDGPAEGDLTLELKYKDLETDEEYQFRDVLRSVQGV